MKREEERERIESQNSNKGLRFRSSKRGDMPIEDCVCIKRSFCINVAGLSCQLCISIEIHTLE